MKIKNLYYSTSAIMMALILSVTGFSTNVEASNKKEPKTTTSTSAERIKNGSIIKKETKKEAYKAQDIEVINIYDPITEKVETHFLTLHYTFNEPSEEALSSAQAYFGTTPLKRYLASEKTAITKSSSRYQSIFDEDCYYNVNFLCATYEDGEYTLTGTNEDAFLLTENGSKYANIKKSVSDINKSYENVEAAFCRNGNNKIQEDDEKYQIIITNLTAYGYQYDEDLNVAQLQEIKNDINKDSNAKTTGKAK